MSKEQNQITETHIKNKMKSLDDFIEDKIELENGTVTIYYMKSLIDQIHVEKLIVLPIKEIKKKEAVDKISTSPLTKIAFMDEFEKEIFTGCVIVHADHHYYSAKAVNTVSRGIQPSDTETVLYGPKDSFTEILDVNLTLIRRRLPTPNLKLITFNVGTLSKTLVGIMYLDGVIDPNIVAYVQRKIQAIDVDVILDSSEIQDFIESDANSLFPQFQQTERPDATVAAIASGKIVILINNSPFVLIAPVTFFEFFQSPEDYVNKWIMASFIRLLRFFAFLVSFVATPLYVAMTTLDYQIVPLQILTVIFEQRNDLPFTPFWEALIILLVLEIIKEVSLRMPSKAGQSLGIIGGLVIGQAAVDAHIASNILIIFASISVLSSFIVPNYLMSMSSRLMQFGILILAYFYGIFGIFIGLTLLLLHLNKLTSLTKPYFAPISPFYITDLKDTFVRLPFKKMKSRPASLNTENSTKR